MHSDYSIRLTDKARLQAVAATGLSASETPAEIRRQIRLAALALNAPASVFLLLEEDSFLPVGAHGLPESLAALRTWPMEWSFLLEAAFSGPVASMPASRDGAPAFPDGLPAFLGAPVEDSQGRILGLIAVWDFRPRTWSESETRVLSAVAETLSDSIESRARSWFGRTSRAPSTEGTPAVAGLDGSLREIETILRELNTPVFAFDTEGNAVYANDAAGRMMGCRDAAEILCMDRLQILSRFEILEADLTPLAPERSPSLRAINGETVAGHLVCYRRKDTGSMRWVIVKSAPVFDPAGKVRLAISVFQDVTDIKNAERELARGRDELAAMLRTMESGCTAQDPAGALVYANDAAARILGYPDADALVRTDPARIMERFEVLDEHRRPFPLDALPGRLALATGKPATGRVMCYRVKATGEEHWSLVNATPLLDDNGKVRLCINVFNDITALKKTDEEMRQSRNQLELVLAGVDDAIFVTQVKGGRSLVFANDAAARLLDFPSVEAMRAESSGGLEGRVELLDESGAEIPAELRPGRRAALGETVQPMVMRIRILESGSERWVMAKSTPIFAADGSVDMVVSISQDITEVRRAGESVAKHMRYLEGMNQVSGAIETAQDVEKVLPSALARLLEVFDCDRALLIHLADADGGEHRVAFSAERLPESEAASAKAKPLTSIPPESGFDEIARACKATDDPVVFGRERPMPNAAFWKDELRVGYAKAISVRPQMGRSWILCLLRAPEASPWQGEDFSLFKDVSSRIAAALGAMLLHRDMRRSEEKYRTLFERSLDGIYRCAPDGTVLDANPALVAMLGFSDRSQLVGTVRPRLLPAGAEATRLSDKGETFTVELERERAVPVWAEINAQPIRRTGGAIAYYEGIVRNVNDRKRAEDALKASEEKLRQSQKMEAVGRLAGGVAHDFNNLLTAINGFSDLLLMSVPKEDGKRVHIEEIRKAGGRAAELTSQLLSFSRKQVLAPRVLDLNAVVSGMETMLRRLIGENIGFTTRLDPALPSVVADPGQMEQVILNLVLNARDAMPDGGELVVATEKLRLADGDRPQSLLEVPSGEYALLDVIDNGTGMDAETQSRLFEPFFTTKSKDKGTGLGLSTVYGAVKQSNGSINVETAPGEGTRFSIYLPAAAKQAKPGKARLRERALNSIGGSETILLVEDEDAVRRLVRDVLEVGGYEVFEAPGGEQALELLASRIKDKPVHLLLTDVVMGGMSGRELAERLNALRPDTKVLFMSGYTEDAIIRHGIFTAQASFIGKPFSPAAIAAKVREVLDGAEKADRAEKPDKPGKLPA
jgi:PAS domain S-box-containing protein